MNKYNTHPNWLVNHRIYRPGPTNPAVVTHCTWHECKGYFVCKSIEGTVSQHFPSCSNSEWFFIYSYPFRTPISLLGLNPLTLKVYVTDRYFLFLCVWLNLHDIVKLLSEKEKKIVLAWKREIWHILGIRQSSVVPILIQNCKHLRKSYM